MYSTIKRKSCKQEGCNKMPQLGLSGWCFTHCPEEIKAKYKSKKDLQIKAANARKYASTKLRMQNYKEDKELEFWFKAIRSKLKGICECGCKQPSSKYNDKFFKFSCAHLLPKNKFKSIATHPMNYLELNCFGDSSCHTIFDNMGYEHCKKTKPILWSIVVERFNIIYPSIAESERKFIPEILLKELKNTTSYNHIPLGTQILPLIPNLQFKLLHESLLKGEVEMYEEITKKYSLESYQKSIVEGLYKQNKINNNKNQKSC